MMTKYTEIIRLHEMLTASDIPHTFGEMWGGYHITYPQADNWECSVIEHHGSYGNEDDLLEIMGLLTDEEAEYDSVVGFLTAEDVYQRISAHYEIGG